MVFLLCPVGWSFLTAVFLVYLAKQRFLAKILCFAVSQSDGLLDLSLKIVPLQCLLLRNITVMLCRES